MTVNNNFNVPNQLEQVHSQLTSLSASLSDPNREMSDAFKTLEACSRKIDELTFRFKNIDLFPTPITSLKGAQQRLKTCKTIYAHVYSSCIDKNIDQLRQALNDLFQLKKPSYNDIATCQRLSKQVTLLSSKPSLSSTQQGLLRGLKTLSASTEKHLNLVMEKNEPTTSSQELALPEESGSQWLLPDELLAYIFGLLTDKALLKVPQVCKHFKSICDIDSLKILKTNCLSWLKINDSIKHGLFTRRSHPIPCDQSLPNEKVIGKYLCVFDNDKIRKYDATTMQLISSIPRPPGFVGSIEGKENHLFFVINMDIGKICVVDLETDQLTEWAIPGAYTSIAKLVIQDNYWVVGMDPIAVALIAISHDSTASIWDISKKELVAVEGPLPYKKIICPQLTNLLMQQSHKKITVEETSMNRMEIKVFDKATNEFIKTVSIMTPHRFQILGKFLFSENNRNLMILDMNKIEWLTTFNVINHFGIPYSSITPCGKIENHLFIKAADFTVTGARIQTWSFNVPTFAALSQIADNFVDQFNETLPQFKLLRQEMQKGIFDALDEIQHFENDYPGCSEHAFLKLHEQNVSSSQREAAIYRYMLKRLLNLLRDGRATEAFKRFNEASRSFLKYFRRVCNLKWDADGKKTELTIAAYLDKTRKPKH